MGENERSKDPAVKSALRALEILELLTHEGRALSFSEILERLRYPKASLHALLRTMVAARWIEPDASGKRYVLGVRVWESGIAYNKMVPIETRALPLMRRVRDLTTETVQLAIFDDSEVLYIGKVDGRHMLRLDSSVGQRLRPHATGVGKILLAALTDEQLDAWMRGRTLERYTPNTIVEPERLREEVHAIRDSGYAVDREERTIGAACVAVGILNHAGACVAAMSVSAPAVRFGQDQRTTALEHLREACAELSATLGYPGGEPSSLA
jgi:DNA-binding IclR family transcriptional regulator